MGRDKLDAIAEGVGSKGPSETWNGLGVVLYFEACSSQRFEKCREIAHEKCRVRFPGRTKFRFNAEVQLQRATLKPGASTSCEVWRLGELQQPE